MGIIFLLAAQLVTSSAKADPYDTLRTNWVSILTGMTNFTPGATNNYNINDPYISAAVSQIASQGSTYLGYMKGNTNTNWLFSNIPITNGSNQDSTFFVTTYQQLQTMAEAYILQGSSLQGNTNLLTNIIHGLDWMNANWYNSNTPHDLTSQFPKAWGWHDLEVVAPQALVNTVAILYTNLSSNQISSYMAAVNNQEQYNTNSPGSTPHFTGANCANKANVITVAGVLLKNSTQVTEGASAYGSFVFPFVTNGDGFYADGSFVFHSQSSPTGSNPPYYGGFPYNSGYGIALLDITPSTLQMLSGSAWDITNSTSLGYASNWTNLITWVFNAFQPIIYNGQSLTICSGRSRDNNNQFFSGGETASEDILRIASFVPAPYSGAMQSMVKAWAQTNTYFTLLANCSLSMLPAVEILMTNNNVIPRPPLVGNYIFPCMDCDVHLAQTWGFGIESYSTRMMNYESIIGDNYQGQHDGDGSTYIYNADQGQYSDNYWWTVNNNRYAGITVDSQQVFTNIVVTASTSVNGQDEAINSTESWVGGVSHGGYGAFGMQLNDQAALQNNLVAKKSWFFFTNEVVCLGAGITSSTNHIIETIVENRIISQAGNDAIQVNGTNFGTNLPTSNAIAGVSYVHLSGRVTGSDISYYFPTTPTLQLLREQRTGSQSQIMSAGSTTTNTNNFFTMWFSHGVNPTNASYSYVVMPGYSASAAAAYASDPPVSIVENSTNAQCVRQTQLGITAANFWQSTNYTSGSISVNAKSSVLVQSNGAYIDLSISDPTQTNKGSISVSYNAPGNYQFLNGSSGINSIVTNGSNIGFTVPVNAAAGQTFSARFYSTVQASATYGNTNQPYSGSGDAATVSVLPSGEQALCSVVYSNSFYGPSPLPPTNVGSYSLITTCADSNYIISGTGVLTITQATPTITVANTSQLYSGSPESVSVTTLPQSLPVVVSYSNNAYGPSTNPPSAAGNYSVIASISGTANYTSTSTNATLLISSNLPAITGNLNPLALQGEPFIYQILATNNPTGFGVNNLPTGLTLNTNTGIITGTVANTGSTPFTIVAYNQYGTNAAVIQLTTTNISSSYSIAGTYSWTCPSNVASLQVQCWGAGGAGGSALKTTNGSTQYAAGGAGGAFALTSNYPVTPGAMYVINVGAGGFNNSTNAGSAVAGGDSWIGVSSNEPTSGCIAKGGTGGGSAVGTGQVIENGGSGTTNGSSGNILYAGGSGMLGSHANGFSGGGGSSAGTNASGLSATTITGATAPTGGGSGGTGVTTSGGGGNGSSPGGGGAGAVEGTIGGQAAGGQGGTGQVVITASQLSGSVSLSNLNQSFSGLAEPVSLSTTPSNLQLSVLYTNSNYHSTNPPTNAGSYTVVALITNSTYVGSTTGTLLISPASPVITIYGATNVPYNGSPYSASTTISPGGIPIITTYNGSTLAPSAIGTYTIIASNNADTINSNWLASSTNAILTIYDPSGNWRQYYYGTTNNSGAAASTAVCGNGLNNNANYTFGINPTNPATFPLLSISNTGSNSLTLSFTAQAAGSGPGYSGLSRYYNLEATTNLTNSNAWNPIPGYSNILGSNQVISLSTNASIGPKWFYRLKAWLQ
jgi:hyaluronate lyase